MFPPKITDTIFQEERLTKKRLRVHELGGAGMNELFVCLQRNRDEKKDGS